MRIRSSLPPEADRLRHVRWIGGGSAAGKSTVARRLADAYGLRLYSSDDTMAEHARRSSPDAHPLLHAFLAMSMDERWLNRPPSEMLSTFHGYRGEAFELIVEDLLAVPANEVVLAEGFRLLPRLVAPLLSGPRQAVWLIPSPEQRRAALEARGSLYDIAAKTSDPDRALDNLLTRDAMFSDEVAAEAKALHLPVIRSEVGQDIADVTLRVADALGLE